ncbi:hypothetical protein OIU91_16425 [Streptomyces sp. NBC_01456]|uniref:hypothetical protein n=1 Tax=Streptomyces sp. NBC_01456 TaxID=2975868 RepID=UPI002E360448|nr:hypothetical protein [Streptomyces sp. NBC_01456]
MTELKDTTAVPQGGWLTDLSEEELEHLVGAMLNVFCGARSNTGLLIRIEDGVAYLFRSDQVEPLQYAVNGTRFERTPGTPMRPALARALVYEQAWDAIDASLRNDEEEITDQGTWDHKRGDYEYGLPDVHDCLVLELTCQLFSTAGQENS